MSLWDRYWVWANRKPSGRKSIYASLVISSFTFVFWPFVTIFVVLSLISTGTITQRPALIMTGIMTLMSIINCITVYSRDCNEGYIDALYQQYLKVRANKMNKLGVK